MSGATRAKAGRSTAGGCDFAIDPALEAIETDVFWRPELDPGLVVVAPSPLPTERPLPLDGAAKARVEDGERWWVEGQARDQARLALLPFSADAGPAAPEPTALAAIVPLDANLPARLAALSRLWRTLAPSAGVPHDLVSPQRRARLKAMLRALDARDDGAAYRDIAAALYGPGRVAAEPWKTSSLRDATLRLVRDGRAMVAGGYRTLLRPNRALA